MPAGVDKVSGWSFTGRCVAGGRCQIEQFIVLIESSAIRSVVLTMRILAFRAEASMSQSHHTPVAPSSDLALRSATAERRWLDPVMAMDLVRAASVKIKRYETAFASLGREVAVAFDRLKTENACLKAQIAELEARAADADERARQAASNMHATHNHCLQLRHQVRDLEVALEAAETHIQKSTGYISRLGAYILRTHAENDDHPRPVPEGPTVRQVEAILRRRAG